MLEIYNDFFIEVEGGLKWDEETGITFVQELPVVKSIEELSFLKELPILDYYNLIDKDLVKFITIDLETRKAIVEH